MHSIYWWISQELNEFSRKNISTTITTTTKNNNRKISFDRVVLIRLVISSFYISVFIDTIIYFLYRFPGINVLTLPMILQKDKLKPNKTITKLYKKRK